MANPLPNRIDPNDPYHLGLNQAPVPMPQAMNEGEVAAPSAAPPPIVAAPPTAPAPSARPVARPLVQASMVPASGGDDVIGELLAQQTAAPSVEDDVIGELLGPGVNKWRQGTVADIAGGVGEAWQNLSAAAYTAGGELGVLNQQAALQGMTRNIREAQRTYNVDTIIGNQEYQNASDNGSWLDTLDVLWRHPGIIAPMVSQSVISSLPSQVGGMIGGRVGGLPGAIAGSFVGGAGTEGLMAIPQYMAMHGVDPGDDQQVASAWANPQFREDARKFAMTRGLTTGAWDAAASLIGIKLLKAPSTMASVSTKTGRFAQSVKRGARWAGTAGTEAGFGMLGEANAELFTGQALSPGDILAEGIGEVVSGTITDALLGHVIGREANLTTAQMPPAPAPTAPAGLPPPPLGMPPPSGQPPPPGGGPTPGGPGGPQQPPSGGPSPPGGGPQQAPPPPGGGPQQAPPSGGPQAGPTAQPPFTGHPGGFFGFDTGTGKVEVHTTMAEAEAAAGRAGRAGGDYVSIHPNVVAGPSMTGGLSSWKIRSLDTPAFQNTMKWYYGQTATPRDKVKMNDLLTAVHNADTMQKAEAPLQELETLLKSTKTALASTSDIEIGWVPSGAGQKIPGRAIDYLGMELGKTSAVKAGTTYSPRAPDVKGGTDVDVAKLPPGVVHPDTTSITHFARQHGVDTTVDMYRRGGSTPAGLTALDSWLRSGGTANINDLHDRGELTAPYDTRLFNRGMRVANKPGAQQAVEAARVRYIEGKILGEDIETTAQLSQLGFVGYRHAIGLQEEVRFIQSPAEIAMMLNPGQLVGQNWHEELPAALKSMNQVMARFKLQFPVTVIFEGYGNSTQLAQGHSNQLYLGQFENGAKYQGQAPGGTITINPYQLKDYIKNENPAWSLYVCLFHEFAHYLSTTGIWKQNSRTRTGLFTAYRRHLNDLSASNGSKEAHYRGTGLKFEEKPTYGAKFEEFFADQVVRYMTVNRRVVLGVVAKVAKSVARMLIAARKIFVKFDPANRLTPEPEFTEWLNEAFDPGKRGVDYGATLETMHDLETKLKNEEAVRGTDYGQMSPETDQGAFLKNVIDGLGMNEATMGAASEDPGARASVNATANGPSPIPPKRPYGNPFRHLGPVNDKFFWAYKILMSLQQVAYKNPWLEPLQRYIEYIEQMQLDQNQIMLDAYNRATEWQNLSESQQEKLTEFLFAMDQMEYLPPNTAQRNPTQQEFDTIAARYGLEPETKALWREINKDYRRTLLRLCEQAREKARQISDPATRAAKIAEIKVMQDQLLSKPYFPHSRFGNWAVEIRHGGKMKEFHLFETQREQLKFKRAAERANPVSQGFSVISSVLQEEARPFLGVPPQMLDMMANAMNLSAAQKAALEQLKYQLSPAQSFKKHFIHRKNVKGWSQEAQRVYAHYMFHHAKHFARVKYSDILRGLVDETYKTKFFRGGIETGGNRVTRISNMMRRHLDLLMEAKSDWASGRAAIATFYLIAVPKSAIINMTQLATATYPFLADRFSSSYGPIISDAKVTQLMAKHATNVNNLLKKPKIAARAINRNAPWTWRMLDRAFKEGFLDEGVQVELAGMASMKTYLRFVSKRSGWAMAAKWGMAPFKLIEQFNRRVTFLTAVELAMNNPTNKWVQSLMLQHSLAIQELKSQHGFSDVEAFAFVAGKEATRMTQFEYNQAAKPAYLRGKAGAFMMFQSYIQGMLFLFGSSWGTAARMMLVYMVIGGLMGLPGAEELKDAVKALSWRIFKKNIDLEMEARKYLNSLMSPENSDIVLNGTGRDSFGIPHLMDMAGISVFPHVDVSKSVSLGRILPMNPWPLIGGPGMSYEEQVGETLQSSAGVLFGMGMNTMEAINDINTPAWDPKRWERAMLPAMRNTSKAWRWWHEGRERTRGGATIATFDHNDPMQAAEIVLQAAGFPPTRVTRKYDQVAAFQDADEYWTARRTLLMNKFELAYRQGEKETVKGIREDILDFNKELPDKTYSITGKGLNESVKRKAIGRARIEADLPPTKRGTLLNEQIKQQFPDSVAVRPLRDLVKQGVEP